MLFPFLDPELSFVMKVYILDFNSKKVFIGTFYVSFFGLPTTKLIALL